MNYLTLLIPDPMSLEEYYRCPVTISYVYTALKARKKAAMVVVFVFFGVFRRESFLFFDQRRN